MAVAASLRASAIKSQVEVGAGVVRLPFQNAAAKPLGLVAVVPFDAQLGDQEIRRRVVLLRTVEGRDGTAKRGQTGVAVGGEQQKARR